MSDGAKQANPFKGPSPLGKSDRLYGRDRELSELSYLLTSERIVLLFSPSGAGKSSLISAGNGLLDRMKRNLEVWPLARVNSKPAGAVDNRFAWSAITDFAGGTEDPSFAGMSLAQYTAGRVTQPTLLVFDQFEEILRLDATGEENLRVKRDFFRQLGDMLLDKRIWALLVLREDYLAQLEPYRKLVPTHLQNRYRIDLLTVEDAKRDMRGTAERGGGSIADDALEALANNLATVTVEGADGSSGEQVGDYVEPLQLQVVCRDLWEKSGGAITAAHVASSGSINQALGNYYSLAVAAVSGGNARTEYDVRQWVEQKLISAGRTRDQVRYQKPRTEGLDAALVDPLIDQHHVLRREPRLGSFWVELAHDRLMTPVIESNKAWFESQLGEWEKRARAWELEENDGLKRTFLVAGADRAKAVAWAAENPASRVDMAGYLAACGGYQKEVDRKRREVIRLRLALALSLLLVLVAGVAALVATDASWKAQDSAKEAQRSGARASWASWSASGGRYEVLAQRERAEAERDHADQARKDAEESGRRATVARLVAEAGQLEAKGLLQRALVAAIEAYRRGQRPESYEVLQRVATRVAKPVFIIQKTGNTGISDADAQTVLQELKSKLPTMGKLKASRSGDRLDISVDGAKALQLSTAKAPSAGSVFTYAADATGMHLAELADGLLYTAMAGTEGVLWPNDAVSIYGGLLDPPAVFHCWEATSDIAGMIWSSVRNVLAVQCRDNTVRGLAASEMLEIGPVDYSPTFSTDGLTIGGHTNGGGWATRSLTGAEAVAEPGPVNESENRVGPKGIFTLLAEGGERRWSAFGLNHLRIPLEGKDPVFGKDPYTVTMVGTDKLLVYTLPAVPGGKPSVKSFPIPQWTAETGINGQRTIAAHSGAGGYIADGFDQVKVWDNVRQRQAGPLIPLADGEFAAEFSPSEELLIVNDSEPRLRVMALKTGNVRTIEVPSGVSRLRNHIAFSADEKLLAVLAKDRIVHVYRTATGQETIRLAAPPGLINRSEKSLLTALRMAFSADNRYLHFLAEGKLHVWMQRAMLDPAEFLRDACERVSRNMTWQEWQSYFGAEPYRKTCPVLNPAAGGQMEW